MLNVENTRETLEEVDQVEGPEMDTSRKEIEMVLKPMNNNKASGPSGVSAEMFKALGQDDVDWLYTVVNITLKIFLVRSLLEEHKRITSLYTNNKQED